MQRFDRDDREPIFTLFNQNVNVWNTGRPVTQLEYSQLIGCFMYGMTCTRPDIAYVVGELSSYTSNYNGMHYHAVNQVLRYLRHTIDYH